MTRKPTDATGFTPDTSDAVAVARHLDRFPEDAGHELIITRDAASVQVRRRIYGGQGALSDNVDGAGNGGSGSVRVDSRARIDEVTDGH